MNCRHIFAALVVTTCSLAGISSLLAQGFTITISVDENGNGAFTNTNGFFSTLPAALLPDPSPAGLPAALTYGLLNPPGLVPGDLILTEPSGSQVSDLIRFNPDPNGGSLVFYSDNLDGVDALADTGFPRVLYANNITFPEVGPEGANGFTYTPLAGQPGFVAGSGGPVTYVITSDSAVPEPCTFALFALGVLWLIPGCRRTGRAG